MVVAAEIEPPIHDPDREPFWLHAGGEQNCVSVFGQSIRPQVS
jgi:hypothetical protein